LDYLLEKIWDGLKLLRIYPRKKGNPPDWNEPFILRKGATVESLCIHIHENMKKNFKYAFVWGKSVKYSPQRVGLSHKFCDEDVVQIFAAVI
jgi:uncharacterized protein